MILCWIKIIWYKINKRHHPAETGTEPRVGARATDENSTEVSELSGKVLELINRGLVSVPVDGDLYRLRMDQLYEDHHARELQELESGRGCPCGGRHYPEPDACRWCRCHDPRNVHHLPQGIVPGSRLAEIYTESRNPGETQESVDRLKEQIMGLAEIPVRPSAEIVKCGVCGHPRHPSNGAGCPRAVPSGEPSGGIEGCRCNGTRILDLPEEYPITDEATDAAWNSFLGIRPDGVEGEPS